MTKFKHRGRNEHGVTSTNKENSLTAMVGHVIEGLKSSAKSLYLLCLCIFCICERDLFTNLHLKL